MSDAAPTGRTPGGPMTAHDPALVAKVAHLMDPDVFGHNTPQHQAAQAATVRDAAAVLDLLAAEGRLVDPDARRVVLLNPGDVLLIGGIDRDTMHSTAGTQVGAWFTKLGIAVHMFADHITIGTAPARNGQAPDGRRA